MTQYSFTLEQRQAFRSAITNSLGWDSFRKTYNLTASSMTVDDMLRAALALGLNPADYGTPKGFVPHGKPKPRPYGPEVTGNLETRFQAAAIFLPESKRALGQDILKTVKEKQDYHMTEGQFKALSRMIDQGLGAAGGNPAPLPLPLPESTPAPAPAMPYGPEASQAFYKRFGVIRHKMPEGLKADIVNLFGKIFNEQNENMTQEQYQNLESSISKYETETTPKQETTPMSQAIPADAATALQILMTALGQQNSGASEARIIELIKQHGATPATVTVDLRTPDLPRQKEGVLMHHKTPLLLSAVNAGVNVMLIGPAGSGKTTAAHQIAETMGLPFYFTGAIDSAYKLTGFIDAQGRTVRTAFREAYEHGGVFLFDELDGSMPSAVLAFNAALANGHADFPDGMVNRHKDFRAIAAMNTYGRGASREYVGRLQLDAASLDRFVTLAWDYDTALEAAFVGAPRPAGAPLPADIKPLTQEAAQASSVLWLETVQALRAKIERNKIRHIVSPRATLHGAKLLAAGWPYSEVMESVLYKGIDSETRAKIAA